MTRTKHGRHTTSVVVVLNICVDGAMESKKIQHLAFRWCGETQKLMEVNAISAVAMFLNPMSQLNITFLALIGHLRFDQFLIAQMSLYQQFLQF